MALLKTERNMGLVIFIIFQDAFFKAYSKMTQKLKDSKWMIPNCIWENTKKIKDMAKESLKQTNICFQVFSTVENSKRNKIVTN